MRMDVNQNPDTQNVTQTKRGFAVQIVSGAAVAPRETTVLRVAARGVADAFNKLREAVRTDQGRPRPLQPAFRAGPGEHDQPPRLVSWKPGGGVADGRRRCGAAGPGGAMGGGRWCVVGAAAAAAGAHERRRRQDLVVAAVEQSGVAAAGSGDVAGCAGAA